MSEQKEANRTKKCNCCNKGRVRFHVRTHREINNDPDWATAICPDCDMIQVKPNA